MNREDAFFYHAKEVLDIVRSLPGKKPYDELSIKTRRLNKAVDIFLKQNEDGICRF